MADALLKLFSMLDTSIRKSILQCVVSGRRRLPRSSHALSAQSRLRGRIPQAVRPGSGVVLHALIVVHILAGSDFFMDAFTDNNRPRKHSADSSCDHSKLLK